MLRRIARRGIPVLAALLGLLAAYVAPAAMAAATYDVTQVGDVGFSQVWNATGNKEVKSGDTIGFNPWSARITLEGHIDDISALAAGDVVSVPLTSDAGSHFSMNGTGWECADDVATSDGTVAFKANMRDGRADLRLTRTAARLSGRFDFRVVVRNGNLWYANQSTSSTWHAGSGTFAFHNTTKPKHRCVNDTTGVGVNSTKSGVGVSPTTWNCATVNRIARGGTESDTAPDVTYHIHVASADEAHPVTVASGTRAFEAYYAYDGTTAGDAFTGPGGGSHVAYTPKRTDGTPTAGEYRLVANADGSYDFDLDIGPREGTNARRFAKPAVDATTAELMEASNMLFQVDYGGIGINFDSSTEKRSAVVTWTSSERPTGGSFLASNTITTNTGRSRALIAYDGNGAESGGVAPTVGDPGTTAKAAANGFTRTGHTFTGWNTRRDGTGTACQAGDDVAYPAEGRTLTLYAQWRPITYKVRFDGNGAASGTMADLTATYDAKAALPANRYAKSGETFAGWNTKADGSGAMYRNRAEATNLASSQDDVVVLYAQWEDAMTAMPETGGTVNDHRMLKTIGGGLVSSASSSFHSRGGACAEAGSVNRKGGVTC